MNPGHIARLLRDLADVIDAPEAAPTPTPTPTSHMRVRARAPYVPKDAPSEAAMAEAEQRLRRAGVTSK